MTNKDIKNLDEKVDQLLDIALRSLVFSMFKEGYPMNKISKNLHIGNGRVVKMLEGLDKTKDDK